MTATDKAAKRLLATITPPTTPEAEVNRSVVLAEALQAVIKAHIVSADAEVEPDETNALVSGMASAVGWLISFSPHHMWPAAIKLLVDMTLVAAQAHAKFQDQPARMTH